MTWCGYSVHDTKEFGNTIGSHSIESEEGLKRKKMVILMTLKNRILVSKPKNIIVQWWTDSWQESKKSSWVSEVDTYVYS